MKIYLNLLKLRIEYRRLIFAGHGLHVKLHGATEQLHDSF